MSSGEKMWGGRFEGTSDPAFEAFNCSLGFDFRLLQEDLEGSSAWARALGRAGVLEAGEVDQLVAALEQLGTELRDDPTPLNQSTAEDVHGFVENALQARLGDLARKLHTGRSRNDQVATDLKLYLRGEIQGLCIGARDLMGALVDLAHDTADLALPGHTHLQRAQAVTAGHHALAFVEMLARDVSRLEAAQARADTCPLGAAALGGTAWPVDRKALAADLGFGAGPTRNSMDAVSDRDHATEVLFACSLLMVHLSRLAEDWIFYCSQEAGYLRLGDTVSTGSSLMPQKRNPDALELVRGKCARVQGDLTTMLTLQKGLPLTYDKDLQEDKECLFDALDTTRACLQVTTTVVRSARYDAERCHAACAGGFMEATDLADLLVQAGLTFRDAHGRVGAAVRAAEKAEVGLADLDASDREQHLPELAGVDLASALSVEACLKRHDCLGGTAPTQVLAQARAWKERLES